MESRLGTLTVNFTPETPESELSPTPLSCPYVSLPLLSPHRHCPELPVQMEEGVVLAVPSRMPGRDKIHG